MPSQVKHGVHASHSRPVSQPRFSGFLSRATARLRILMNPNAKHGVHASHSRPVSQPRFSGCLSRATARLRVLMNPLVVSLGLRAGACRFMCSCGTSRKCICRCALLANLDGWVEVGWQPGPWRPWWGGRRCGCSFSDSKRKKGGGSGGLSPPATAI